MEPLRGDDPRRVGRYTLVARLGAGGMGRVFLGFSPAGRPMAVKVVHPELARDRAFLSRFKQEVAAARRVSGAYTAPVVDAGDGDLPWFATTLVAGPSLTDTVERLGPLSEIAVWRLAAGLAEALADVHSCGLIHRDLKPSNVLLAADGPRVIDFGISRALDVTGMTGMTGTGMLIGTPSFMSPEQASGTPVGPASDVFSFGDGNPVVMIYRVVHSEPTLTGLPPALTQMVSRCLVKRPDERATLAELMEIITVNLTPVTSAASFWPGDLARFIGSYQASFAADTWAWSPPAPARAEPSPPEEPVGPPGPGDLPAPADVAVIGGEPDEPATITAHVATPHAPPTPPPTRPPGREPTPPPTSESTPAPPPLFPVPVAPPPVFAPPTPRPTRRLLRVGTLAAGIVVLVVVALGVVGALTSTHSSGHLTVASAQPPGGFGTIPAETGTPHAGVVSFGVGPNDSPNWILPIVTDADNTIYNVSYFDYEMWRPLYWPDTGVSAAINPALSLAKPPVWSNGDKTVTITMNPSYKWSDGRPVSSQDVAFDIDLIKAAVKQNPSNWADYNVGEFPDDLASLSTPDQSTLVLNLTSAVNPSWFYQNELSALQPMPAHAWAKAAASGPVLDFGNPANAAKIYDYLAAQSNAEATWATNPLWQVVDGPYRLASFDTGTGALTMAANPGYGGPDSHQITSLSEVPFSSDAAEFQALQAGSIDVGYVPSGDVSQAAQLRSRGYNVFGYPSGFDYAVYNFKDTTGDFGNIVAQLYFRQAMAQLQDQQYYVRAFMDGAGTENYGPVPRIPPSQYTPGNAGNTYPFSLSAARNLLTSHGWNVIPGGTDTCVNPGSATDQCGAGIPAGTKLAFNLVYNNLTLIQQEVTALASAAKQAGISITLVPSSFNTIIANDDDPADPGNANKWAMSDFGGFTASVYPTTITVFNTPGISNFGGYSDPQADSLINASVSSANPDAVTAEAAYLTAQQPGLFQPTPDIVFAWKKTLSGPQDTFANLTQYYLTPEQWYYTG